MALDRLASSLQQAPLDGMQSGILKPISSITQSQDVKLLDTKPKSKSVFFKTN